MADYSAGRLVKRKQRDGSYQWQARIERHGADGSSKTLSKSTGIECDPPSSKDRRGVPSGKGAKSAAEALTMLAWQSIPGHLSQENKKFIFGQVRKGARASDLEESLAWLQQAGLLYKVSRASKPHVPLKAYCNMNAFKVFVVDVGLLGAMSGLESRDVIAGNKVFTEFKGALTEQYVCQQLIAACGLSSCYWSAENSSGEIGFLAQDGGDVFAIEVKAEQNLRAKSLRAFKDTHPEVKAMRFSLSGYREQDWMRNVPLYAISCRRLWA